MIFAKRSVISKLLTCLAYVTNYTLATSCNIRDHLNLTCSLETAKISIDPISDITNPCFGKFTRSRHWALLQAGFTFVLSRRNLRSILEIFQNREQSLYQFYVDPVNRTSLDSSAKPLNRCCFLCCASLTGWVSKRGVFCTEASTSSLRSSLDRPTSTPAIDLRSQPHMASSWKSVMSTAGPHLIRN